MSDDTLSPAKRTRLVATSFLALFSIVGLVLYGLPQYYDLFVQELGWTRAQVTSGNMIGKVFIGPAFGFLAGMLIDRVGPRKPMIIGVLVAAAALVGLSTVDALSWFYLFYAMNALGYVLAGPLPNQVLLSRNFKQSRGKAMGIAYVGIGIGFFFVPQIAKHFNATFGWRNGLIGLGILVVIFAMPLILFLREGEGPAAAAARSSAPKVSIGEHLRHRNFYLLALGSMASIGAVGSAVQHFKMMMTLDNGWSQAQALDKVSMIAAVSLIGRFGAGWLADKIGPKRVMLIVYALVAVSMLVLVTGAQGNTIYLYVLCFGLGLGGEYLIIPLMAAQMYGTVVLGRMMGIILTADGVAEALFPYLVGRLRDSTGSYALGFQLMAALAAVGALAVLLLPDRSGSQTARVPQPSAPPA